MQATVRQYDASRNVIAIDPGPERSAWLYLADGKPTEFGICDNRELLVRCHMWGGPGHENWATVVIEKIEGFGMAVGAEVFETVFWSGKFAEASYPLPVERIGRRAIKVHLCGTAKAKDANIRQALIDRFGGSVAIGKKATPGPLYGVTADVWSALAVAVTYADGVR